MTQRICEFQIQLLNELIHWKLSPHEYDFQKFGGSTSITILTAKEAQKTFLLDLDKRVRNLHGTSFLC